MSRDLEEQKGSLFLRVATVVLGIVILLAVLFLFIFFGCRIKKVTVTGNELHEDQAIEEVILNDRYSWNSVYVYIKYKFCKPDTIPFVDTVEVTLVSPTEVKIEVYEKDVIGYLYVDATGQNAYIDRDGIVEELSTRIIDGAIEIKGLNVGEVTLYETLQTDNRNLFKNLLSLTNTLRKYHISPSVITVKDDSRFYLTCGDVKVNFGTATDLNDKIVRLEKILPQLEGMKGELHLEEWENENSDITFEKKSSKKKDK